MWLKMLNSQMNDKFEIFRKNEQVSSLAGFQRNSSRITSLRKTIKLIRAGTSFFWFFFF